MKLLPTKPFDQDYEALPKSIRKIAQHKFRLLLENPRHPSLRVKKMDDPRNIWEARITQTLVQVG